MKSILFESLQKTTKLLRKCEDYSASHDFRNLDHLLEYLVFEAPFAALVIIDDLPESLETILAKKFQFGVEVIELTHYVSKSGEHFYRFKPFLADVAQDLPPIEAGEVDTVVVPARADGVQEVFLVPTCVTKRNSISSGAKS